MTQTLKIALAQVNLMVGDVEGNAERIIHAASQARDRHGAQLVLFPELAITGYPPEDLLMRGSLLDRVTQALEEVAHQVRGIDILLGAPLRDACGLCNSAVWLREGKVHARYHKQILPNYSVFDEKRYFCPGDQACVVEVGGLPMGITVCEDIWQPEPARRARDAGARLILNINASPFHRDKHQERLEVLRARVAETGLPIAYVNLVGGQDELVFDGHSMAVDADGSLRLCAPPWQEGLYLLEVQHDAEGVRFSSGVMAPPQPAEASLYDALVLGVRDYVNKNGFKGAVLGLSGGIDSALTLCIAVDALGAEAVEAIMMPYHYTASMSREDASAQAELLGVRFREIPIAPMVEAFMGSLSDAFAGLAADTTEENIQARCRGTILMAFSNKTGRMLLTTGNKSEMAVGYATLYGDMAGGFAPLKDLGKLWVYRLSRYRNQRGPAIPERVIERPPSAELAPDQRDEDSLPPYEILDAILERFVERDESFSRIVDAGYDETVVRRVIGLVLRNEYKRRQAPPGVRVTPRAFGKDRRYPITSGYGRLLR
ncbi:NAD+ synthase [Ectothiorhodospira sp. BSL-9]|uniref:NAD+ synthase n=1 Tax=Ectothiorhodospira sp. BSL-9 TaxID=1442136 RepID=UPI0007B424AD|nr:NAD+ synthase [Ectothiorhodospira sp. BSL-9]ANB01305.1 NAD synthetase [Ectothiorhodospira sp. BSL-9]TVQ70439.1 MAG: NAD+ synthase [Chromatiaceae bacterium]